METAIKKKIIFYDAYRHEQSLNMWNKKTELSKSIKCEFEKYFPGMKVDLDTLFPFPEVNIYKLVEKQYAQNNPMGLSGLKLAELKEIDFRHLLNNQLFAYGKLLELNKPVKADYTYYAETPTEIERLQRVNNFIEAVVTFSEKETFNIPEQYQVNLITKGAVTVGRKSDLIPNHIYVKDAV